MGQGNCKCECAERSTPGLEIAGAAGPEGEAFPQRQSEYIRQATPQWTPEMSDKLQASVDTVFGTGGKSLLGLDFSFTMADPQVDGCPLIGCSTGFTKLCGYEVDEIVGRNCRFLVDPVPKSEQDTKMRKEVREYCEHARDGKDYQLPEENLEDWYPKDRPCDELWCCQKNARKDGSLFWNMFLLKVVQLGADLGEEKPYIVALQSDLPDGKNTLAKIAQNIQTLDSNMDKVLKELAANMFVQCVMVRQGLQNGQQAL